MNYNVMRLGNLLSIILDFLLLSGGSGRRGQVDDATLHDCKFANFMPAHSPHQRRGGYIVNHRLLRHSSSWINFMLSLKMKLFSFTSLSKVALGYVFIISISIPPKSLASNRAVWLYEYNLTENDKQETICNFLYTWLRQDKT